MSRTDSIYNKSNNMKGGMVHAAFFVSALQDDRLVFHFNRCHRMILAVIYYLCMINGERRPACSNRARNYHL